MRRVGPSLALLALAACSPVRVEDLRRPAYVWFSGDGLCGRTIAVDGAHVVWRESACESNPSLAPGRTATGAEVRALSEGFARLRDLDSGALPDGGCGYIWHSFELLAEDESSFVRGICAPDGTSSYDDVSSLPVPAAELAVAFQQLPD